MITSTKFRESPKEKEKAGLFAECRDPRCDICKKGYIKNCGSFDTANGIRWEIRSHINCNTKNVIYQLTCNSCTGSTKESKIGKTFTKLRYRLNNHISDCRTGNTTDVFDLHVHTCGKPSKNLVEPYFKVHAYMALSSRDKLLQYEKEFQKRNYATITT